MSKSDDVKARLAEAIEEAGADDPGDVMLYNRVYRWWEANDRQHFGGQLRPPIVLLVPQWAIPGGRSGMAEYVTNIGNGVAGRAIEIRDDETTAHAPIVDISAGGDALDLLLSNHLQAIPSIPKEIAISTGDILFYRNLCSLDESAFGNWGLGPGDIPSLGRERLASDVLLHEMVHQYVHEIVGLPTGEAEHGRTFTNACNRLGRRMGLARVRAEECRVGDTNVLGQTRHRSLYWPDCVRPVEYYTGAR